jgi:hypothetical protein
MSSGTIARIPFVAVAAALAAGALGIVVLGIYLKLGVYSLALLSVPVVIGLLYLSRYSGPGDVPPPSGPAPEDAAAEPFDDPVEEADRIDAGSAVPENESPPGDPEAPVVSEPTRGG